MFGYKTSKMTIRCTIVMIGVVLWISITALVELITIFELWNFESGQLLEIVFLLFLLNDLWKFQWFNTFTPLGIGIKFLFRLNATSISDELTSIIDYFEMWQYFFFLFQDLNLFLLKNNSITIFLLIRKIRKMKFMPY